MHALVVGGTGMLADVSLWLVKEGYHVSVVARSRERMEQLIRRAPDIHQITPLYVDYREGKKLREKIRQTVKENGEIDRAVLWIHSVAKDAFPIIVDEVSKAGKRWELFHILGSSANLEEIREKIPPDDRYSYHQIQLGFVQEPSHSRWLTNQEIAQGVIQALQEKKPVKIIGVLTPWEKRPQ